MCVCVNNEVYLDTYIYNTTLLGNANYPSPYIKTTMSHLPKVVLYAMLYHLTQHEHKVSK